MDRTVERLTQRLAVETTRRRFLGRTAALVAGVGAVIVSATVPSFMRTAAAGDCGCSCSVVSASSCVHWGWCSYWPMFSRSFYASCCCAPSCTAGCTGPWRVYACNVCPSLPSCNPCWMC